MTAGFAPTLNLVLTVVVCVISDMVTSSLLLVPCCVLVCVLVLHQMRSYLLLINFADTVRDIVSWLGRCIQVLVALNHVDPLKNCDVCEQNNYVC